MSLAHKDLGLLSLVLGDTPGLEVWDYTRQSFLPIERTYTSPTATVMVGRELEYLSNGRFRAGGHLVRSYGTNPSQSNCSTISVASNLPSPMNQQPVLSHSQEEYAPPPGPPPSRSIPTPQYRYSIVFVLRSHWPVPIDIKALSTPITGPLRPISTGKMEGGKEVFMTRFTAKDMFFKIKSSHFNINTGKEEREKQRVAIQGKKELVAK